MPSTGRVIHATSAQLYSKLDVANSEDGDYDNGGYQHAIEDIKSKLTLVFKKRAKDMITTKEQASEMQHQVLMKTYVAALAAVEEFGGSTKPDKGALGGVLRFLLLVFVLSVAFVGVAVGFASWGGEVSPLVAKITASNFFGWPADKKHSCYATNGTDGVLVHVAGATIRTENVPMDGLLVSKNLYCGLMLGLVFGFLDNFGLFYGMDKLDPVLYKFGTDVISGAMHTNKADHDFIQNGSHESPDLLVKTHSAADKLMAGLGNTFSDILGVILGTGALVIAKAGLGVEPAFWPLDIVAMLLGCLLGAFLPAFADEASTIGGSKKSQVFTLSWVMIAVVFLAILFAGVPEENYKEDWSFYTSLALLGIATLALTYLMIVMPMRSKIGEWRLNHIQK